MSDWLLSGSLVCREQTEVRWDEWREGGGGGETGGECGGRGMRMRCGVREGNEEDDKMGGGWRSKCACVGGVCGRSVK